MSTAQEDKLIKQALVLETKERTQFLNKIEDKDLKQKIAFLLKDDKAATQFVLKTSVGVDLSAYIHIKDLNSGDKIKQFTIVRLLAKGGMGSVYLAYDEKLKRNVAIKTIRSEYLENQASQQRFKREAQILSQINHPSICQIYEYIDYEDGDVLVLELVNGKTLNSLELTEKQKLDVFIQMASALVVAHDLDVIHRDLKPDNIMVTSANKVKILDFGIAKSKVANITKLEEEPQQPAENLKLTKAGSMMGTLLYMSPEQAAGQQVTKASDIYSMGIIMQEILTGVTFYKYSTTEDLRNKVINANNTNTELIPKKFQSLIKALTQKQPQTRPRAIEVASMLNEIIEKPKRRLKRIMVAIVLLIALAGFGKYTYDLKQEKTKAELARVAAVLAQEKSEQAKERAENAKNEAEQVTEFLESLFRASNPYSKQGKTITARQMLDDGATRLDKELKDQPRALVRLKMVIGEVYRKMGLYSLSLTQFKQASSIFQTGEIDDVELHIKLLDKMVPLEYDLENYDKAINLLDLIMKLSQDNNLTDKDIYLSARFNTAVLYEEKGEVAKAAQEFKDLLVIYMLQPEKFNAEIVTVYNALGLINSDAGNLLIAKDYMEKALLLLSPKKDEDLELKTILLANLATILGDMKRYPQAIEATLSVIKLREQLFGKQHKYIAMGYRNLSKLYCEVKEFVKCTQANNKALEMFEQTTGKNDISYAKTLHNKAIFMGVTSQNYAQAEPVFKQALKIITSILGQNHVLTANLLSSLGKNHLHQQQYQQAIKKLKSAIDIYTKLEKPMVKKVADAWLNLGITYQQQGSNDLALKTYQEMLIELQMLDTKDQDFIEKIKLKIQTLSNN